MSMKKTKKINPSIRLLVWKVIDLGVSILPLITLCLVQFKKYFGTTNKKGIDNMFGMVGLVFFVSILAFNKNRQQKEVTGRPKKISIGMLVFWIILCLLKDLLNEMLLIGAVVTAGMLISDFWSTPKIIKWIRIKDKTETAIINAEAMDAVFNKYNQSKGEININGRG